MKPLTSKISSNQQILEHLRDILLRIYTFIYIYNCVPDISKFTFTSYRQLLLLLLCSYNFNDSFSFEIVNSIIYKVNNNYSIIFYEPIGNNDNVPLYISDTFTKMYDREIYGETDVRREIHSLSCRQLDPLWQRTSTIVWNRGIKETRNDRPLLIYLRHT